MGVYSAFPQQIVGEMKFQKARIYAKWGGAAHDGFRDGSDCSRKVYFTYFYHTHGVEQAWSYAGSYAHALLLPQDHKETFNKTLMVTELAISSETRRTSKF
jgi:hypothetical protein